MAATFDHFAAAMSYPHHQQFLFSSNNTQPTAPAPAAVSEQDSAEPLTQQDAAGFTNPFFISDYGYDQQLLLQQLAYGLEVADYISLDDVDVAGANSFGVEGTQTPISSDQPHLLQLQTTTATTTPTVSYTEEETGSTGVSPRASHQAPAPAKKAKSDGATNKKIGFRTKSEIEIMDDGFKWRKYGKKSVKNSPNPRNYYKCSAEGCRVKKRVERDREDARYVITTYEGVHNHISPSEAALFYNTFPVGGSGRGGLISLTAGGAVPSPSPPYRWPTTSNTAAVAAYSAGAESSNGPDGWDACIPFSFS